MSLTKEKRTEYQQRYRSRHPEAEQRYRQNNRLKVLDFFGRKCVRCGFSDIRALQIDHIHGNGTKHRSLPSSNGPKYYKYVLTHPTDFQILCANCNWIKRYENNEHSYQ